MSAAPTFAGNPSADGVNFALTGDWTLAAGAGLEKVAAALANAGRGRRRAVIDISAIGALDTAGAWIIDRTRQTLSSSGVEANLEGVKPEHATLLCEAGFRATTAPQRKRPHIAVTLIADIGETVVQALADLLNGLSFLGRLVSIGLPAVFIPARWRFTSLVFHIENIALRGTSLILMINFFVGMIIAQQGIIQLQRFGAASLTAELTSILSLRELGVLLTSIMIAGRSGSAITAEIGAMQMREEIDALRVMALDPTEVLILPRLTALVIALPLLTFLGDIAALFGGMIVTWVSGGVSPVSFIERLVDPISVERFEVGMIKAPFMALVIGIVAAAEGFAVSGSAESLGAKVTSSVVKSIFMVIVLDGVFAMFFAAVDF